MTTRDSYFPNVSTPLRGTLQYLQERGSDVYNRLFCDLMRIDYRVRMELLPKAYTLALIGVAALSVMGVLSGCGSPPSTGKEVLKKITPAAPTATLEPPTPVATIGPSTPLTVTVSPGIKIPDIDVTDIITKGKGIADKVKMPDIDVGSVISKTGEWAGDVISSTISKGKEAIEYLETVSVPTKVYTGTVYPTVTPVTTNTPPYDTTIHPTITPSM